MTRPLVVHRQQAEVGPAETGPFDAPEGRERITQGVSYLLSMREVAKRLSLSYAQARALVIYGHIPAVRLPVPASSSGAVMRRLLVDAADLTAFVERCKVGDNVVTVARNEAGNTGQNRRQRDATSRARTGAGFVADSERVR